jgi:hypothetical protein
VPAALREAGARVELLRDHYAPGTIDRRWLAEVGRLGRVVLTKDANIRRRRAEISTRIEGRVAAFVLRSANLTGANTAAAFVRALPGIRKRLRDYEPPFVAAVDQGGRIEMLTQAVRRAGKKRR